MIIIHQSGKNKKHNERQAQEKTQMHLKIRVSRRYYFLYFLVCQNYVHKAHDE